MTAEKRRIIRKSRAAEARTAARSGGRRQPASGAFWGAPGDIITDVELIEHKMTGKKQITLKADWLEENWEHAVAKGKRAVLQFELNGKNYFTLEEADYEELRDRGRDVVA